MSTFLDVVNRVMRINTIIGADDDDLTSFDDVQHVATLQLAKIAIQATLTDLTVDRIIPYEDADGTITVATGTRTYSLPADFIRFKGEKPFLLKLDSSSNSANTTIEMYHGGEERLRREILNYREQSGEPRYFYKVNSTTKKIGLFHVPDSSVNGVSYRFPYEKSIYVAVANDTMPFITEQETDTFSIMAARRFQFMFTSQPIEGLQQDSIYKVSKANLMELLRTTNPSKGYGYTYR